jgi:hypothetical protein
MKRLISAKPLVAAAIALGAIGAASVAHARSDVHWSIAIQAPLGYVEPAPVYVQPQPVYVQPQPIYYGRGYDRGYYVEDYDRDHRRHWRQGQNRRGPWGDYDRDGVANRYDRFPGNPYRR